MTFNPDDYVSASESIILSGIVKEYVSEKLIKLILTNKKMIMAGDDDLRIIPLNCISEISWDFSKINISTSTGIIAFLSYRGNLSWYNEIVIEISKRIG